MGFVSRTNAASGGLLIVGLLLAGCAPAAEPDPEPASPPTMTETSPPATRQPGGSVDVEAAFAEREQFFKDQRQPLDGSMLVAQTDAQKEYIAREKEFVEAHGLEWSPDSESMYLALALDACEASILQGHDVTVDAFSTHIATSPLFAMLVPADVSGEQRRLGERNASAKMVGGVSYLCEADLAQWLDAYNEVYPPKAAGEAPLGG